MEFERLLPPVMDDMIDDEMASAADTSLDMEGFETGAGYYWSDSVPQDRSQW